MGAPHPVAFRRQPEPFQVLVQAPEHFGVGLNEEHALCAARQGLPVSGDHGATDALVPGPYSLLWDGGAE